MTNTKLTTRRNKLCRINLPDRLANALKLAKTTAQSCNHSYIGTEHILVGLLKEKEGTAGRILEEFNVEEDALRQLIEELIAPSEVLVTEKAPEYSPKSADSA